MNRYRKREKAKTGTGTIDAMGSLLTMAEVSRLLHVHANTVRRWSDLGIMKAYRIGPGHHRRFKAEDLTAFLVERPKRRPVDVTRHRKLPKRGKPAS